MGRPVRGSRLASFYSVDPNISLTTLDSAFQLQEYISNLVRLDPHDVDHIVTLPGAKKDQTDAADAEKQSPTEEERPVDEACWIYEQLRRLAQDLTHPLITTLLQECTRQSCPEMKAGEWLYLCVAHGNSGVMEHCCAIDYIIHTLDSATALLNSPRAFPSRISIPNTSHRHFPSLARRLGRIFAHAYYHHRATFESAEAETGLYARFLALAQRFDLVPADFLVIPPRSAANENEDVPSQHVTLLTRENAEQSSGSSPRIGGRSRTDTMYLSGGFSGVTAENTGSRSSQSSALFVEYSDVATITNEVAENSRVIARDFALPQQNEITYTSDPTQGAEMRTGEVMTELEGEETDQTGEKDDTDRPMDGKQGPPEDKGESEDRTGLEDSQGETANAGYRQEPSDLSVGDEIEHLIEPKDTTPTIPGEEGTEDSFSNTIILPTDSASIPEQKPDPPDDFSADKINEHKEALQEADEKKEGMEKEDENISAEDADI